MAQKTPLGILVACDGQESFLGRIPAATRQRKGWLVLVPGDHVGASALAAAHDGYYASSHYDVESTLLESLRMASVSETENASETCWKCCGAVLMGLDVTALLPKGFGLWVANDGRPERVALWPMPSEEARSLGRLWRGHHRIRPGETLVLGPEGIGPVLQSGRARRLLSNPERLGILLEKTARRQGLGTFPMAWMTYPTGPAVGLEQPWQNPRPASLLPPRRTPAKGRLSPIWLALAIAVLSAVGVYAVKQPALPKADLAETVTFLLTVDRLGEATEGDLEGLSPFSVQ